MIHGSLYDVLLVQRPTVREPHIGTNPLLAFPQHLNPSYEYGSFSNTWISYTMYDFRLEQNKVGILLVK